jgi:hypothetical protein
LIVIMTDPEHFHPDAPPSSVTEPNALIVQLMRWAMESALCQAHGDNVPPQLVSQAAEIRALTPTDVVHKFNQRLTLYAGPLLSVAESELGQLNEVPPDMELWLEAMREIAEDGWGTASKAQTRLLSNLNNPPLP